MTINYLANLGHYVPELLVIGTMLGALLIEATYKVNEKGRNYVFVASTLGMLSAIAVLCFNLKLPPAHIFTNALTIDPFSTLSKIIMLIGGLGVIHLSKDSKDIYEGLKSEFIIMTLGVIVGGMLLASANNLLTLFLGVETLSILSYVLATFKKFNSKSAEAGLKYVLYGGLSSGIMLFGIGHIYGLLGTIHFVEIVGLIGFTTQQTAILIPAFLFFFVGLGYKLACVPFHMWAPDVYEGSPLPVTTFFAIIPKVAALTALVRVSHVFFSHKGPIEMSWVALLQIIAALTMTVGNVSAINQKSVKRMLAFSSIAHAGMMMLGALTIDDMGASAILFYAVTYVFMTLVAFYIVSYVADHCKNDDFERFNGLIHRYPLMAILLCISMFSLAGLPPLSGFVAKFHIISAVVAKKYFALAFVAVINSVISLYYYTKIVKIMIFNAPESEEKIPGFNFFNRVVILGLSLPILFLGIFWDNLMQISNHARIYIQ